MSTSSVTRGGQLDSVYMSEKCTGSSLERLTGARSEMASEKSAFPSGLVVVINREIGRKSLAGIGSEDDILGDGREAAQTNPCFVTTQLPCGIAKLT